MSGPLPTDAQAVDRTADGPVGDLDPMMVLQIPTQQRGGPDGGVIAELPRIAIDHRGDQFVDGSAGRPWSAEARGVEEARPQVQLGSFLEPAQPVVKGLPTDLQQVRNFCDLGSLSEPEQRLGSTSFLGQGSMGDEFFQLAALPVTEREQSHRFTPPTSHGNREPFYSTCRRTSVNLRVFPRRDAPRLENKPKMTSSLGKGLPTYDLMNE